MDGVCPAPGPDDPLVRSLIGVVDCNVQAMVQGGYGSLFQPSGAFSNVLTILLTLYVAVIGYQLLLGRSQLNITDLALTAVKLGAVVALATRWGTYQTLVYHFLFYAPQQVADVILHGFRSNGSAYSGDVFDGLQRAFNDLTSFSPATPPGAAAGPVAGGPGPGGSTGGGVLSTLLSKAGFDSLLMLMSAVVLVIGSLGVLLAAKIVLGILLATGPVFIALLLFDSTRGIFEGWLRACLGFAFAPLAVTLLLGVALNMLEPSLQQVEAMRDSNTYTPGVAFGVMVLVVVFAGVAIGMIVAGGAIAAGWKPSRSARVLPISPGAPAGMAATAPGGLTLLPRADRTAAAVAAQERRDTVAFAQMAHAAGEAGVSDRRTTISTAAERAAAAPREIRLGQEPRRKAAPRAARSGVRSGT